MPYYIVRHDKPLDPEHQTPWDDIDRAVYTAAMRHKETGYHYYVMMVETAWTTKTLAELMQEDAQ